MVYAIISDEIFELATYAQRLFAAKALMAANKFRADVLTGEYGGDGRKTAYTVHVDGNFYLRGQFVASPAALKDIQSR
jgi:hypothetical protein